MSSKKKGGKALQDLDQALRQQLTMNNKINAALG